VTPSMTTAPLLDDESLATLTHRSRISLWILLVLAFLATGIDIVEGSNQRVALVAVGLVRFLEYLALAILLTRASSERWIVVAATSATAVSIGTGFVLGGLRQEFGLPMLIGSSLCIAAAVFMPWGWRMQLVPVITAAIAVLATLWVYGTGSIAPQSIVQTASCLAISVFLAVDHERLWRSLARYNADIVESHAEIARLRAELERRVAAREGVLDTANRRLEWFCESVATDLRPKLAAIRVHLLALQATPAPNASPPPDDLVERVRKASIRMEETLDALLDYVALARAPLHSDSVNLSKEADAQIRRLRELEPDRRVVVAIHDGMVTTGDSELLTAALHHLIDNAWKFSGTREVATIEIGARTAIHGQREFFVRDNGVGFDMAHVGNLFKPFMRLEAVESFPGHGMGLARTARIVARHGGTVHASAAPGKGAELRFTLNAPAEDVRAAA